MALVGMVALLTAGLLAAGAHLQAGLPRRFPVAHGAGRVSDRRRDSGRHRDARRHARRATSFRTARLVSSGRSCAGRRRLCPRRSAVDLRGGEHPPRPPRSRRGFRFRWWSWSGRLPLAHGFDFAEHGIAVIGPVPGGLPSLEWPDVSWREILDLLPVAGVMLRDDHRAKRGDRRAHSRRRFRERVDEDADILGIAAANAAAAVSGAFVVNGSPTQTAMADQRGRAQPGRATRLRRRRAGRAAVPDRPVAVPAALRAGGHRVHDRGRHGRCAGPARHPARKPGRVPAGAFHRRGGAGDRRRAGHSCSRSLSRLSGTSATAIGRTRWCSRRSGQAGGCRRRPRPGSQTEPGLIIYRFGADLFYANADRFADEVRASSTQAPAPVRWFVVDAERDHGHRLFRRAARSATCSTNWRARTLA